MENKRLWLSILACPPKTLLLIDGAGALLTALSVGVLLPLLGVVGIPIAYLHILSIMGVAFSFYSFACYFLAGKYERIGLAIIALANVSYCIITIVLMYFFAQSLSVFGWVYFVGELMVVGILVYVELSVVFLSINHTKIPFLVILFMIVHLDADNEYVITNYLGDDLLVAQVENTKAIAVQIEEFHRSFKYLTGSGKCQCRKAKSQKNHFACCYHAWVSLKKNG